jgi:hypothetical protein
MCRAMRSREIADGSYAQQKDLMMGTMPMPMKTYGKDTAEARAWEAEVWWQVRLRCFSASGC